MSETVTLAANAREGKGSRAAGKLRKQGLLPGIVYGHKQDPVSVTVNYSEFDKVQLYYISLSFNFKKEDLKKIYDPSRRVTRLVSL